MYLGPNQSPSHSQTPLTEINITPFVDVILVLLIIFMVTAPLAISGVDVKLPNSSAKSLTQKSSPLVVSVSSSGEFFLGKSKVSREELVSKLSVAKGSKDAAVLIRADKKTAYDNIMMALSAVQAAGISKISMLSESSSTLKK